MLCLVMRFCVHLKLILVLYLKNGFFHLRQQGDILAHRLVACKCKSFASEPQWRSKCFNFRYRCDTAFAPPTVFTRTLSTVFGMASSAKKRAVGLGENPEDSENSSDDNLEEEDDSGEEDSEASEEEINEVETQRNKLNSRPC